MSSRHRVLVGLLPATKRQLPLGLCATLPLSHFTRAPEAGRTRPEEPLDASAATNLTCRAQGRGFDSPRGVGLLPSISWKWRMKNSCAHSESVESNLCKLWQNYSDCSHEQCGSLLWLNVYCPFTNRNIAHGQKRTYIKKRKCWLIFQCRVTTEMLHK